MTLPENPRIAIAGSVNSSRITLQKLIDHQCNVVGVLGLHPESSKNVSGYVDLEPYAEKANIPFKYFQKINDTEVFDFASHLNIDLLFVIGLSQLVREPLLSLAKRGNVGFHPTKLPKGRGRGAVAWMILGKAPGAATFFLLDEGMDSGPILGQHAFEIEEQDYARDVIDKIESSISKVLDQMLPALQNGRLNLAPQDHSEATYLGRRKPKDGLINWGKPALDIQKLIRATSTPLPGAFTVWQGEKLIIYKATVEKQGKYFGIPGRILEVEDGCFLVACEDGSALWVENYETNADKNLRVGNDLG